jgi:hypothetical protein
VGDVCNWNVWHTAKFFGVYQSGTSKLKLNR